MDRETSSAFATPQPDQEGVNRQRRGIAARVRSLSQQWRATDWESAQPPFHDSDFDPDPCADPWAAPA